MYCMCLLSYLWSMGKDKIWFESLKYDANVRVSILGPISMESDNNEMLMGEGLFSRKPLIAENTEEVLEWLEVLVSNRSFRTQVSRLGIGIAQKYSLKAQVQEYSDIFCKLVR